LTELVPLALVVAISPLSIIPAVLVLHTPRPKPTSLAYLAGWVFGLAALTAVFVEVSSLLGALDETPTWASWLRIVIGVALIVFGVFRWLTRKRSAHSPAWMNKITGAGPGRAAVIAAVLVVVNPKVLFICAAAGLAIGTRGPRYRGCLDFRGVLCPCCRVFRRDPVLAYAVMGDRLDGPLTQLKDWMERHNAALVAAILFVIGVLVLYKGVHGLSP